MREELEQNPGKNIISLDNQEGPRGIELGDKEANDGDNF